jgi:hypothetical protein
VEVEFLQAYERLNSTHQLFLYFIMYITSKYYLETVDFTYCVVFLNNTYFCMYSSYRIWTGNGVYIINCANKFDIYIINVLAVLLT